jgi:riboflavin synthase
VFTGIIEEIGTVEAVTAVGAGRGIRLAADVILGGLAPGDSVAIDGACLTVTRLFPRAFAVEAVATTLARTTLGELAPGRRVNLERAAALGDRLGGHLVQGHVDGTGRVVSITPRDELTLIDLEMPAPVAGVTVLHGSITMAGISLTVNDLPRPGIAQVSIIPFTRDHTTVLDLREGDAVNLEGDLIGKYVRQLLGSPASAGGSDLRRAWGYE